MPAIIPVAGMQTEFGMEWDASLVPVGANYTALEATVFECLHAGCSSIWIVANDDVAPLLRLRLGEYATDIRSIEQGSFKKFGATHHTEVPIYYVPIHPKHRDKVDNYAWSAIYGANVAYWIMTKFSRWTRPSQYYVSFPMGMMDPKEVLKHRAALRNVHRRCGLCVVAMRRNSGCASVMPGWRRCTHGSQPSELRMRRCGNVHGRPFSEPLGLAATTRARL